MKPPRSERIIEYGGDLIKGDYIWRGHSWVKITCEYECTSDQANGVRSFVLSNGETIKIVKRKLTYRKATHSDFGGN